MGKRWDVRLFLVRLMFCSTSIMKEKSCMWMFQQRIDSHEKCKLKKKIILTVIKTKTLCIVKVTSFQIIRFHRT